MADNKIVTTPPSLQRSSGQNRIIGLDLLRVLLAFLIFLYHSRIHIQCDYGILNALVNNGHIIAMTAFFMLSGYSLVISNGNKEYQLKSETRSFFKKRFISIYPLYFTVGVLSVIFLCAVGAQKVVDNLILLPVEALCLQSFYDSLFFYAHNNGTWFISCLVFCYFLFPWLILLFRQWDTTTKVSAVILLVLLLSYFPYVADRFNTASIYTDPFFRLLEFSTGMLIAMINKSTSNGNSRLLKLIRTPVSLVISLVLLFVGVSRLSSNSLYYQWLPIVLFTPALFSAGHIKFSAASNNKVLLYLSSVSYAFFLGQILVWLPLRIITHHYSTFFSNIILILLSLSLCFILAVVLHELIEKPASRWLKDKLG